eukprot:5142006-Pleurochrysis_carterae.AAC.1
MSSSTLARARHLFANCRRAHLSFAVPHSHAWFTVFASHRMRTRGAQALRSLDSWIDSLTMATADL